MRCRDIVLCGVGMLIALCAKVRFRDIIWRHLCIASSSDVLSLRVTLLAIRDTV